MISDRCEPKLLEKLTVRLIFQFLFFNHEVIIIVLSSLKIITTTYFCVNIPDIMHYIFKHGQTMGKK